MSKYRKDLGEDAYLKACEEHALPVDFETMDYETFLQKRRGLMSQLVKEAYEKL